ncbi:MAG: hypothetical protein ACTSPQ_21115 [Candidatus Helarchaeota archaeon]
MTNDKNNNTELGQSFNILELITTLSEYNGKICTLIENLERQVSSLPNTKSINSIQDDFKELKEYVNQTTSKTFDILNTLDKKSDENFDISQKILDSYKTLQVDTKETRLMLEEINRKVKGMLKLFSGETFNIDGTDCDILQEQYETLKKIKELTEKIDYSLTERITFFKEKWKKWSIVSGLIASVLFVLFKYTDFIFSLINWFKNLGSSNTP